MITILLIALIVLLLGGGGYAWRGGYVSYGNPLGIVLLVVLILLLLGVFGGPRWGWW